MTSRFFLENSQEFLLENKISKKNNPDVFHHLKDVLRVNDKDLIELVADQSAYLVQVNEISAMEIFFNRSDKILKNPEMPIKTTIVVPLLKADHLDWLIQKATELGVFKIILTSFSYSVVKDTKIEKKVQRYEKIVKAAAEQSHRLLIPEIIYEKNFIKQVVLTSRQIGIVAWEESAKAGEKSNLFKMIHLADHDSNFNEIVAVFGPEGGISKKEIEKLELSGFIAAGLGPRILRAETAPLYLLSSVSLLIELS
ncbi:16S rRNA (uracil(1498)-N(3))-methyltransferase [Oenococcus sp. UCMA 17063]|nr:16S rRNA (uracil(1498)-N(3))-methyltransferase [Oenococcus sp. UCMA 17063]